MKPPAFAFLLLAACAGPTAAQTIANISVEPASAKVGEPVTITANFDDAGMPNCNVRVNFGDGATHDFKINQAKDVPLVTRRTYARPGQYRVRVEGKTALPMLKCLGQTRSALLTVEEPAPPPPQAAAGAMPTAVASVGPACPDGWTLDVRSVNDKTGAFTCSAKAGTALPMVYIDCPGALRVFREQDPGPARVQTLNLPFHHGAI